MLFTCPHERSASDLQQFQHPARLAMHKKNTAISVIKNISPEVPHKTSSLQVYKTHSLNDLTMNEDCPSQCSCSTKVNVAILRTGKCLSLKMQCLTQSLSWPYVSALLAFGSGYYQECEDYHDKYQRLDCKEPNFPLASQAFFTSFASTSCVHLHSHGSVYGPWTYLADCERKPSSGYQVNRPVSLKQQLGKMMEEGTFPVQLSFYSLYLFPIDVQRSATSVGYAEAGIK